jgi:Mn2+/Fe2+ NRAMP family transporter
LSRPGSTRPAATDAKPRPTWWRLLGAGLVTGAADDDPSGIATYSHGGAQWGFSLAWTLFLTYPLMVVVQSISAQIGRVTGRGIAGNLRVHYAGWLLQSTVALLYLANTLNLGADLGAMAASSTLLGPRVPAWIYVVLYALVCTAGPMLFKHQRYVLFLKWLSLSLLSYVAVLAALHIHWLEVLGALLFPRLRSDAAFWTAVVAILGTTISPYLFFGRPPRRSRTPRSIPSASPS